MHNGYCLSDTLNTLYASCSLHICSSYAYMAVNTFQLKEWFGYHKYMYYAHCAIHNGSKNIYKKTEGKVFTIGIQRKKPLEI